MTLTAALLLSAFHLGLRRKNSLYSRSETSKKSEPSQRNERWNGSDTQHENSMQNASTLVGAPRSAVNMPEDAIQRFWKRVEKTEGCWLWTSRKDRDGYGHTRLHHVNVRAHRLSWMLAFGDVPDRLCVLHHCDVRNCVNPKHLYLGTNTDNNRDKVQRGRQAKGDRQGLRLHPERVARGERSGKAKLTNERVIAMRELFSQGHRQAALARLFNVGMSTVGHVVRQETWRHI